MTLDFWLHLFIFMNHYHSLVNCFTKTRVTSFEDLPSRIWGGLEQPGSELTVCTWFKQNLLKSFHHRFYVTYQYHFISICQFVCYQFSFKIRSLLLCCNCTNCQQPLNLGPVRTHMQNSFWSLDDLIKPPTLFELINWLWIMINHKNHMNDIGQHWQNPWLDLMMLFVPKKNTNYIRKETFTKHFTSQSACTIADQP